MEIQLSFSQEPVYRNMGIILFSQKKQKQSSKVQNMFDFDDHPAFRHYRKINVTIQELLDRSVPFTTRRWAAFGVLLFTFLVRIFVAQGWYIVCYALGISLLNMFLAFLTPKFDPSLEQELMSSSLEEGGEEPREQDDEFRPFIRRLPEFKFWLNATMLTFASLVATFFSIFDIPVFWPILLVYFIILFVLTMRRQIQHMIKYKYVPLDLGCCDLA